MTHAWIVAFAIWTLPVLSAAQEPEPAAKPIDAKAVVAAMDAGIAWLVRHQDETGVWSASQFQRHDPKTDVCTGTGKPEQDLFVTAWATLALLARTKTERLGPHAGPLPKALRWLESQMRADGFVGTRAADNAVLAHALSCVALSQGKVLSGDPPPKQSAECLLALRLPDGTWPARIGATKGDPMTTCWAAMICQLSISMSGTGVRMDLEPTLEAIEKGVLATASLPSAEAMLRWFARHEPTTDARLAELCRALRDHRPQWRSGPDAARMDYLDWNMGTRAVFQMGGESWQEWTAALQAALVAHQRTDGAHAGSWDPVDAHGPMGGRVYATAVNVCSLSFGEGLAQIFGSGGSDKK
ncbi:MAG TPA: hypothetical protein VF384_03360 [Planctomycetota bacterium]